MTNHTPSSRFVQACENGQLQRMIEAGASLREIYQFFEISEFTYRKHTPKRLQKTYNEVRERIESGDLQPSLIELVKSKMTQGKSIALMGDWS